MKHLVKVGMYKRYMERDVRKTREDVWCSMFGVFRSFPIFPPPFKAGGRWSSYPAEFKKIRPQVVERDRICQGCGSNLLLQVHHKDRDKFNNDLDNLILLCFPCHQGEHDHKMHLPKFLMHIKL